MGLGSTPKRTQMLDCGDACRHRHLLESVYLKELVGAEGADGKSLESDQGKR